MGQTLSYMFEARLPVTPKQSCMITQATMDFIQECFSDRMAECEIQDIQEWLADNGMPDDPGLDVIRKEFGNLWLKREDWTPG